jgi:hypothetical protein
MRPVDKWRRLAAERRQVLPWALVAVVVVRLCLRFLPLPMWGRAANRLSRRPRPGSAQTAVQDIVWAVRRVSQAVPGATCLTQALAAQLLLSRRGYASRLTIGVARMSGDGLRAHAWLESGGQVVLGDAGLEKYTPLIAATGNAGDFVVGELGASHKAEHRPGRHSVFAAAVETGARGCGASRPRARKRDLTMGDR